MQPPPHLKPGVRGVVLWCCAVGLAIFVLPAGAVEEVSTEAGAGFPAQTAYLPDERPAPVVMVISGQSGPTSYRKFASDLAGLGYYTVLLAGKDILNPERTGETNLKKAIERAHSDPKALPGKVAVVGFSLGGGAALYNAAPLSDQVSIVVAYYPYTRTWSNNMDWFVKRFKVPVLVMPGALDHYQDCCVIESMRAMEAAARRFDLPFEMVVYPDANHGFNLETGARGEPAGAYRPDDERDAWRRTVEKLKQYQPLH